MMTSVITTESRPESGGWKWQQSFPEAVQSRLVPRNETKPTTYHRIDPKNLSELLSPVTLEDKPADKDQDDTTSPRTLIFPASPNPRRESTDFAQPAVQGLAGRLEATSLVDRRHSTICHVADVKSCPQDDVSDPTRRASAPSPRSREATHSNIVHLRLRLQGWGAYFLHENRSPDAIIQAISIRPKDSQKKKQQPGSSPNIDVDGDVVIKLEPSESFSAPARGLTWICHEDQNDNNNNKENKNSMGNSAANATGETLEMTAVVWPKNAQRSRFAIRRVFNLTELRATIPDNTPARCNRRVSMPITTRRSTIRAQKIMSGPGARHMPPSSKPVAVGRRPSTAGGQVQTRCHLVWNNSMPIHLPYARAYLPVLAALLLSGYIKKGDSIELPLPCPSAWKETIEYVYGVSNDLSEAVRENILHLGGKV